MTNRDTKTAREYICLCHHHKQSLRPNYRLNQNGILVATSSLYLDHITEQVYQVGMKYAEAKILTS